MLHPFDGVMQKGAHNDGNGARPVQAQSVCFDHGHASERQLQLPQILQFGIVSIVDDRIRHFDPPVVPNILAADSASNVHLA